MVSPPTSPGIASNPKYPLFNRLLHESQTSRGPAREGQGRHPVCPATAPVLSQSCIDKESYKSLKMEKEILKATAEKNQNQDEDTEPPIKLLDPPKSKLKRQLSIDTAERTDALRARKRALLYESDAAEERCPRTDEVDGGRSSTSAEVIKIETTKPFTSDQFEPRHVPVKIATSSGRGQTFVPDIIYDKQELQREFTSTPEYPNIPLQSPNRFNLSDIGLTSPFASRTPIGTHTQEKEVFIFPDSVPPRKVSPYKSVHDDCRDREVSETGDERSREMFNRSLPESVYRKELAKETDKRISHTDAKDSAHSKYSGSHLEQYRKEYVTEKGFAWPEKATITEPVPFSPRIVTTDSRPRFPSTSTSSERIKKTREEDELKTRLAILEREYARANEIYGSHSVPHEFRQMSPTSRNVESLRRGTFRSISNKDRSPNEKDIRETCEEVRNRYERSFSDPRYSPRQLQGLILRPSPLCRQHEEPVHDTLAHERYPELWREDVKRRLFVKGDINYGSDYRRQQSSQYNAPVRHTSTEIPEEVLQFLHSRNFHPEELENLKDVLRRGGSPHRDEQAPYVRSPSVQFDDSRDLYARCRLEGTSGRRDSNFEDEYPWNIPRERQHGDIDVRLSCESIKEKTKKTEEILNELDHDNKNCKCAKIEQEIRFMAMDAYSKIRRADRSAEAHDQFQNELNETNANVYNSMRVLCGIKCLCKYGRTLDEVFTGSVVFRLNCPNVDALLDLWHLYKSGDLLKQLRDAFINEDVLEKYGCEEINLKVVIGWQDYLDCKQELETSLESSINRTPTKSPVTPVHKRTRSEPASVSKQANQVLQPKTNLSPFRERFCSDSSVELSPRRAFQELNAGKHPVHPPSPSKKYFTDNVFSEDGSRSPLTTQRRKTFVFRPEKEQENVEASKTCAV